MRLFRCVNPKCREGIQHGHDFTAEGPVATCPKCGVKSNDPKFGHIIVPLVVIHFNPPSGVVEGIGAGFAACEPTVPIAGLRATGVPSVVNCPKCIETEAYKKAFAVVSLHPDYDVELSELASVKGISVEAAS